MLCGQLLRQRKSQAHGSLYRGTERVFDWMRDLYAQNLAWVLRHRTVMLVVFVAVGVATAYLYTAVPKGFIPDTDNDQFSINLLV
jgi:multidrug efflux pump subunit AcrB